MPDEMSSFTTKAALHPADTDRTSSPKGTVDPKLLELLVCPVTKSTLEYDAGAQELISRGAGLAFPIRDGIPVMLVEEAREMTEEERDKR